MTVRGALRSTELFAHAHGSNQTRIELLPVASEFARLLLAWRRAAPDAPLGVLLGADPVAAQLLLRAAHGGQVISGVHALSVTDAGALQQLLARIEAAGIDTLSTVLDASAVQLWADPLSVERTLTAIEAAY